MNFINSRTEGDVAVELKYCERCGSLWLRGAGETENHCRKCRLRLAELLRGRTAGSERKRLIPMRVEWLLGVAETEVRL